MTERELIKYRKQFRDNHETFPEVLNLKAHERYAAGEETSNRRAPAQYLGLIIIELLSIRLKNFSHALAVVRPLVPIRTLLT